MPLQTDFPVMMTKRTIDMRDELHQFTWPASRLGEALEALARKSGLPVRPVELGRKGYADHEWIAATAGSLGLEVEAVEMPYAGVERQVQLLGPALLRLPGTGEARFLALLGGSRRTLVLGPDLAVRRLLVEQVRAALCHEVESPLLAEIDRLLDDVGVPKRQQVRARRAILRQRLGSTRIAGCWLMRLPPGASFWRQLRQ